MGFLFAGVSLNGAIKKRSQSLHTRIKFYFDQDMFRNSLMVHSIGWWAWCGLELPTIRIVKFNNSHFTAFAAENVSNCKPSNYSLGLFLQIKILMENAIFYENFSLNFSSTHQLFQVFAVAECDKLQDCY